MNRIAYKLSSDIFLSRYLQRIFVKCLNINLKDFAQILYDEPDWYEMKDSGRKAYIEGKFLIFADNPSKLICQLDSGRMKNLTDYFMVEVEL